MSTIIAAPSTFQVDVHLAAAFKLLGYEDVNNARSDAVTKAVRNILHTFNIKTWDGAYRGIILKEYLTKGGTSTDSTSKIQALVDVITVCCYYYGFESEPDEDPLAVDLKAALFNIVSNSDKASGSYKVGELDKFSGKDRDWMLWKERSISRFKIDGLYEIITDEGRAVLNQRKNTIVHGMLVRALLTTKESMAYPCLMAEARDNGFLAWKQLCDLYEHKTLIKNLCRELHMKIFKLHLEKVEHWDTFTSEFMNSMNTMIVYQEKAEKANIDISTFKVVDWKTLFLEKINVTLLNPRVQYCSAQDDMTVWTSFLNLKGFLIEKNGIKSFGQRGGARSKPAHNAGNEDPGEEEEAKDPEVEPRAKAGKINPFQAQMQMLHSSLDKLPEADKAKFKELLKEAKEKAVKPQGKQGFKRRRLVKQRRVNFAPIDGPVVDKVALDIIGGTATDAPLE
jgi:hypothetical protein